MKTVLFCPGFRLSIQDMTPVINAIRSKGYEVKGVPINWRGTTINNWCGQLESAYAQHDPEQTILAGYSFGAITALAVAAKCNPSALWLFSLAARFVEDLPELPEFIAKLEGKRRTRAFFSLSFGSLAPAIACPTLLIMGELERSELPNLAERVSIAERLLPNARLVVAPDASHDPVVPSYLQAIAGAI